MASHPDMPDSDVGQGEKSIQQPAAIAFSGVVDARVIRDLHRLYRKKIEMLSVWFLGLFLLNALAGVWSLRGAGREPGGYLDALELFAYSFMFFPLWLSLRKGWAHKLIGQEISGEIHAVGIIVQQLHDRATWDAYRSAWLSDSAALLFQGEKEIVPHELELKALTLHRTFFESSESWQQTRQLIRERIPKIRMVAS